MLFSCNSQLYSGHKTIYILRIFGGLSMIMSKVHTKLGYLYSNKDNLCLETFYFWCIILFYSVIPSNKTNVINRIFVNKLFEADSNLNLLDIFFLSFFLIENKFLCNTSQPQFSLLPFIFIPQPALSSRPTNLVLFLPVTLHNVIFKQW